MSVTDNLRVRIRMNHLSFVWLIAQLKNRGITTDKTEVSSVFAGTRTGRKADAIIAESEVILNEYEKQFGSG